MKLNKIRLAGEIGEVKYSYTYKGTDYYKTYITAHRQSGNTDTIPVILPSQFKDIQGRVCLIGEVRTRNIHKDGKSHLDIFVFVKEIETYIEDENYAIGDGYICKEPLYRVTPLLRRISDVLIACNREEHSDYIPSIAWGRNAERIADFKVGTHLKFEGRLQSRRYMKAVDEYKDLFVERTAYELSMSKIKERSD